MFIIHTYTSAVHTDVTTCMDTFSFVCTYEHIGGGTRWGADANHLRGSWHPADADPAVPNLGPIKGFVL